MYPDASKLDRYLTCFNPWNCHIVCAPQGKPYSGMDGDQPTAAIEPHRGPVTSIQSVAMYPVDGDFIIWAFADYGYAKDFALRVGNSFPKLGQPPVITVQPSRIEYLKLLENLAYAMWDIRTNGYGGRTPRKTSHDLVNAAGERDRNLACTATNIAWPSTPSTRHIFEAARQRGYTL
jgi:hypothetical protein